MKLKLEEKIKKISKTKIYQHQTGITLIALVITIVVLLVLAGVSINTLFGDNGIINSASKSGDKYKMEAVRERVETVKVNWEAERIIDETVTVDKFWEELADADIRDRNGEIREKEKTTEDGVEKTKYEVDTKEGYVIGVIITDKNGKKDITIIDIEDGKKALPIIKIELTSTTNSITVKVVEARRIEGNLIYSYKLQEDKEYTEYKETTDKEVTIDNLIANKIYEIKVEGKNKNGPAKAEGSQRTGELEKGTITASKPIWNNGTASITLNTTSSYGMQYQIGAIEESGWKNYTSTGITGLSHNTTVYARIYDGTNGSEETSITILDKIAPTVTINNNVTKTTNSITIGVTSNDGQSGIPNTPTYNFYIKKSSETAYVTNETKQETSATAETSYTFNSLEAGVSYDVKVTVVDNAGNVGETTKTGITTNAIGGATTGLKSGNIIASNPTWSNGTASITLSTTSGLTIQYQINSISAGGWKNYTSAGVTGLSHNTTVYARLTDGINNGQEASITILDRAIPQEATITFSATKVEVNKSITATVTLKDNESGINPSKSKWEFNQTSTAIGTEESKYSNTFVSETGTINIKVTSGGDWYLHVLSVDNAGNKKETVKGTVKAQIAVSDYTWTQNKTQLTGTHKTTGATVTKEVGENYDYACGVSSYTGGWKILGAENGKLLIMSTKDIGTLKLEGKAGYNTGVTQLDNMCKPYGTNARSIKVEDINRVTGYNPNKTGDGKKFEQGKMWEYGNRVTYTSSGSTGTNGQTYNGGLYNGKYEHPDGRAIGSNGVTSITETSTYYYYYPDTLTTSDSGTTVGIAKTTPAYKLLFRNAEDTSNCSYWLASSCVFAANSCSNFGLRFVHSGGIVRSYTLWDSNVYASSNSHGVRAVVSL